MQLTLTLAEAVELRDLLVAAITDLRSELHHTDSSSFRSQLHERERILHRLQDRVLEFAPPDLPALV